MAILKQDKGSLPKSSQVFINRNKQLPIMQGRFSRPVLDELTNISISDADFEASPLTISAFNGSVTEYPGGSF